MRRIGTSALQSAMPKIEDIPADYPASLALNLPSGALRFDGSLIWLERQRLARRANEESFAMMKFRHLIWMLIAAAGLMLSALAEPCAGSPMSATSPA